MSARTCGALRTFAPMRITPPTRPRRMRSSSAGLGVVPSMPTTRRAPTSVSSGVAAVEEPVDPAPAARARTTSAAVTALVIEGILAAATEPRTRCAVPGHDDGARNVTRSGGSRAPADSALGRAARPRRLRPRPAGHPRLAVAHVPVGQPRRVGGARRRRVARRPVGILRPGVRLGRRVRGRPRRHRPARRLRPRLPRGARRREGASRRRPRRRS